MFLGTSDKTDVSKNILVETYYLDRLNEKYLSSDCFSIIILRGGNITAKINDTNCFIQAPAVLCLDEIKKITLLSNNSFDVRIIKFNPILLNTKMDIRTIRNSHYDNLCQQHSFLQLSPFLTEDLNKICIRLGNDTLEKLELLFDSLAQTLQNQEVVYWPYRARTFFMDIIILIEKIYYNFSLDESVNRYINITVQCELKNLLSYINNNLNEKLSLQLLYEIFRINKNQIESMFKKFLNTTFYEYLRKRRFEEATYYLRFTDLDGEQIASCVGFSSSQNFCKFFKSMCGITPNQFRKEAIAKRKKDNELMNFLFQN